LADTDQPALDVFKISSSTKKTSNGSASIQSQIVKIPQEAGWASSLEVITKWI
jgi:hypothetical protein